MNELCGIEDCFFRLLQIAIGQTAYNQVEISDKDWSAIYDLAIEQSLVGVILRAVDILGKNGNSLPKEDLLFQWIGDGEIIKNRNTEVNHACEQMTSWFKSKGYSSCILKGQGVACLYTNPEDRQAGDIDIWVNADRDEIIKIMRNDGIDVTFVDYVNSHASFYDDIDVEVHFRPTWMYNPIANRKVQRWIMANKDVQMVHFFEKCGFCYPTIGFNIVFSLLHIFRHVFMEGIGLRQLTDYYFILTHSTREERNDAFHVLQSFGLSKFVATVMYIMRRVFDIDKDFLLCEPNVGEGEFLLSEILRGGNFGFYDDRIKRIPDEHRWRRGLENIKRNMLFLRHYPNEVVWIPAWKVWHLCWRKWKGYL